MLKKILMAATLIGGIVYFFRKNKYSSTKDRMEELSGVYQED